MRLNVVVFRPVGRLLCVAATCMFVSLGCLADQNDSRLEALFAQLQVATDADAARPTEAQIWKIWHESGVDEVDSLLADGIEAMNTQRMDAAIELFGQVIEKAPRFAEGWNKRATAYFLADDLASSVRDIERTLALEPRHFGAISGMGLIFLQSGDHAGALDAFEKVLTVNPQAIGAQMRVQALREKLGGTGI